MMLSRSSSYKSTGSEVTLTGGLCRRRQRLRSLRGERHLVRDGAVLLAGIRILSCGGVILHLDLREERVYLYLY